MTPLVQGGSLNATYDSLNRAYTRKVKLVKSSWKHETEQSVVSVCSGDNMFVAGLNRTLLYADICPIRMRTEMGPKIG